MAKTVNLNPGEEIIMDIRRHIFPFIMEVISLGVLAVAPPFIFVSSRWFDSIGILNGSTHLFIFGYLIFLLFVWVSFFISWTNYYLDVLVVTNERVIDIDQKRFFYRDIATLSLDKIEDVKVEVKGFLATMLKYGNLYLQTAAESREFIIKNIPNPLETKDRIWNLHLKATREPQHVRVVK